MKPDDDKAGWLAVASHSARSAWIETISLIVSTSPDGSRTPQGVRGLKPHGTIRIPKKPKVALRKECVD